MPKSEAQKRAERRAKQTGVGAPETSGQPPEPEPAKPSEPEATEPEP